MTTASEPIKYAGVLGFDSWDQSSLLREARWPVPARVAVVGIGDRCIEGFGDTSEQAIAHAVKLAHEILGVLPLGIIAEYVREGHDVSEASLRKAWAERYEVKTRREREWIV